MIRGRNTSSRLRQRLTLQTEVQTADTAGGYARTWQNVADLWAEIIPVKGNERIFAGKLEAAVTHRILLRYRAGVTAGQRFLFENRAFNIRAVINKEEGNETLEALVEEGVGS